MACQIPQVQKKAKAGKVSKHIFFCIVPQIHQILFGKTDDFYFKTAYNMGIGGNGAWHPYFSKKPKPGSGQGWPDPSAKPVNSNFLILKASAVGRTDKASLPLRQCLNVGYAIRQRLLKGNGFVDIFAMYKSC